EAINDGHYPGPVGERDIAAAEQELGVRFPTSYRIFLKHFGAAWLRPPIEVAGLGSFRHTDPAQPLWLNVLDVTASMRRYAYTSSIPRQYIPFSDDGGDYQFYLDTGSIDACGESPVVVLGPGRDGVIVSRSFVEFVESVVSGRLDY